MEIVEEVSIGEKSGSVAGLSDFNLNSNPRNHGSWQFMQATNLDFSDTTVGNT